MFDIKDHSTMKWKLMVKTASHMLLVCRLDSQFDESNLAYYLLNQPNLIDGNMVPNVNGSNNNSSDDDSDDSNSDDYNDRKTIDYGDNCGSDNDGYDDGGSNKVYHCAMA